MSDPAAEAAAPSGGFEAVSGSALSFEVPPALLMPAECAHAEGQIAVHGLVCGPDEYDFAEPLAWRADITNTGDALLVTGSVSGEARTACARCLSDAVFPVEGQLDGYFLIDGSAPPEDMDSDEFEVLPASRVMDLEPVLRAALVLELPLVPLCDDDCKGLCPTCGANLNEGPCGCAAPEPDPDFERAKNPFAALADLKLTEGDEARR